MNILIIGSGGREHALAWKIKQSPICERLIVAPGNAGTAQIAQNADINVSDFEAIKKTVLTHAIELVVVGPEVPLVEGIRDFFEADSALKSVRFIGPNAQAARLEGSKDFAKSFMKKHGIPTAAYESFTRESIHKANDFLETLSPPYVLKADGLASGKGVVILESLEDAKAELKNILENQKFGLAGAKVVIEKFLKGIELSVFVLTDGKSYKILPSAKDYKRIGEGDTGLNTGGMGAVSPVPFADETFMKKVEKTIIKPTIEGLKSENLPYKGFIFIGLMKVGDAPFVIEYNVRMGDPETEVVIPRLKTDLVQLLLDTSDGNLHKTQLETDSRTAATVMLVSGGYPENYEKNKKIDGLENVPDSLIFHAGTTNKEDKTLTSGGRVLAVTSLGENLQSAVAQSYKTIENIHFEKMYYRKDIGFDL